MQKVIEDFISKNNAKKRAEYEREKSEFLLKHNIYEKKYMPEGNSESIHDYPYREYDNQEKKYKYYKKIPIKITDEEYKLIKECCPNVGEKSKENTASTALKVIGIGIYVIGCISTFVMSVNDVGVYAIIDSLVSTGVNGSIFIGFSEILNLLDKISKK